MESEHGWSVPFGYAEHPPPADLRAYVDCFWTGIALPGGSTATRPVRRVLPDGCVDIIVGFGGRGPDGEATAVGSMTRPLILTDDEPDVHIGVRFRPGNAFAAIGVPAAELTDERVIYELLVRETDRALDQMRGQRTNEARLRAMIRFVRHRLAGAPVVPLGVRRAVDMVVTNHGNLRVDNLAASIGITRQQLARQFATHVGVTPKTFARVMRARAALARVDAARAAHPHDVDWSRIAYDLGYYDQPHFIDEFKAITGTTPGQWLAEIKELSTTQSAAVSDDPTLGSAWKVSNGASGDATRSAPDRPSSSA